MEKFDAIVVGAGLAGLAAAYTLAGGGAEVLVLERGDYPGAKNVSGGRLYVSPVRSFFPELWAEAPFERPITHEGVTLLAEGRSVSLGYYGGEPGREPCSSYSVLRSRFDRWLAERVEEGGAMLLTKAKADDLLFRDGKVCGVLTGGDELLADVVIACDGVLSLLAERAGLRRPGKPSDHAVGVKEVIGLDPELLEARFGLEAGEGAARLFVGGVTRGRFGGGFLYTNRESVSLGVVVGMDALGEGLDPVDVPTLLEEFRERPEIARLVRGGETLEYSAHVIPEGGFDALGTLHGPGILVAGDAAGLALNLGLTVRGMEYALASGYYAAQTVLEAKKRGSFGSEVLSAYRTFLDRSFVLERGDPAAGPALPGDRIGLPRARAEQQSSAELQLR